MSKNEILNYLKNAKIESEMLRQICYCFSKDFTASQTANQLNVSRQTVNNYYKILRNLLLEKQEEFMILMKENNYCKDSFDIKFIENGSHINYFVECNDKVFIIDEANSHLPNITRFIEEHVHTSLANNRRINSARILFNKTSHRYLLLSLLKSSDEAKDYIQKRLKQFRGLNKNNILMHLKESQFRYNYSQNFLYETLIKSLALKA